MEYGKIKPINMGFNYKMAAEIINCFNSDDIQAELNKLGHMQCMDADTIISTIFNDGESNALKPTQFTLLHHFCEQYLYHYLYNERYYFLDEICSDLEADFIIDYIDKTARILAEYGVPICDYRTIIKDFDEKNIDADLSDYEYEENIRALYDDMFQNFDLIESNIIEATFYLLYDNKGFLFKFNKFLSNYVNSIFLPEHYFDDQKHIKRCQYLPEWLKRAVFYRDNGRCQHCGKDLSGLLAINDDALLQYDHIIPLEQAGTNDATNFQILCRECNIQKSSKLILPKYFYQMYW
ncbi:HNH endonuclease signature motif containing protein [Oscillibacter sp.]|uniref:HNH endonuclease n=1 Tax=Oscillibacter sp. TaxID=1945593 RepID=UPI0028B213A9|nr:HNH endonuclease signature motif containing protein [Oscillibacter sp.]